jgi:hypothetical protein
MALDKIKDYPDLAKDPNTKAVVNIDNSGLSAYRKQRDKQKALDQAFQDINNMKQEFNDIKTLMQRILDKIG